MDWACLRGPNVRIWVSNSAFVGWTCLERASGPLIHLLIYQQSLSSATVCQDLWQLLSADRNYHALLFFLESSPFRGNHWGAGVPYISGHVPKWGQGRWEVPSGRSNTWTECPEYKELPGREGGGNGVLGGGNSRWEGTEAQTENTDLGGLKLTMARMRQCYT